MDSLMIAIGADRSKQAIRQQVDGAGHVAQQFGDTAALLRNVRRMPYAALLIDMGCSRIDWQSFVHRRRNGHHAVVPVILFSSTSQRASEALASGADDFVAEQAASTELVVRVEATVRRLAAQAAPHGRLAGISLDRATASLTGPGGVVTLTARELALAQLLFEQAGRVVSRARIASDIWEGDEDIARHSVEQHAYQLRRKFERCAPGALALRSVYGNGYRLDVVAEARP